MHGIVFTSLRHFVTSRFGASCTDELWESEPPFLATRAYPDEEFHRLLGKIVERTRSDPTDLLRDFGEFAAARTFACLYPAAFVEAGGTRAFLLTVEERIHELVRATVPDASPPALHVEPLDDDSVKIVYTSPRRLCVLLRGLVMGTASHYGERVQMRERACILEGGEACIFEVRVRSGR